MKYLMNALITLCMLLAVSGCMAEAQYSVLLDELMTEYNSFDSAETTERFPICEAGTDEVYEWILCTTNTQSDTMLRDSAVVMSLPQTDFGWNAFDCGERAMNLIYELYYISMAIQDGGKPMPVDVEVMSDLFDARGNSMTIYGLDSAYACGEGEWKDGRTLFWDVLPFVVQSPENEVFQVKVYLYFEMVVRGDESDDVYRHIMADQNEVCDMFGPMLSLIPDINQDDRKQMLAFIELNRQTRNENAKKDIIGKLREEYERYIAADTTEMLSIKLEGGYSTEYDYLQPLKPSDAAFGCFARSFPTAKVVYESWDMDWCVDCLLGTTSRAVDFNNILRGSSYEEMTMDNVYADIINAEGLNLVRYESWYIWGEDEEAGFRWEVLPFSLQMSIPEEPGVGLSRPNLYVRMLTLREGEMPLSEEWIIEDAEFIESVLPGYLSEIEADVKSKLGDWYVPDGVDSQMAM